MVKVLVNQQGKVYTDNDKALTVSIDKYGCTIDNLLGDVDANGELNTPSSDTSGDIVFSNVKNIKSYALGFKYTNNLNFTHGVSFPDLISVSGSDACYYTFYMTGVTSISIPKLTIVNGDYSCYYMFGQCYSLTSISLPELTTVSGNNGCYYMFNGCTNVTSISVPKLTTISGLSSCNSIFRNCYSLTTASLPELTTISGSRGMQYSFESCSSLVSAYFPKLSNVFGGTCLSYSFSGCPSLTNIYFNALTTTSFGSSTNQFQNMFNANTGSTATGGCTVHFPSNLSSTISGLTGYPTFGGSSSYIHLAFDLTATT